MSERVKKFSSPTDFRGSWYMRAPGHTATASLLLLLLLLIIIDEGEIILLFVLPLFFSSFLETGAKKISHSNPTWRRRTAKVQRHRRKKIQQHTLHTPLLLSSLSLSLFLSPVLSPGCPRAPRPCGRFYYYGCEIIIS